MKTTINQKGFGDLSSFVINAGFITPARADPKMAIHDLTPK